jgi:hypothetical protein
VVECAHCKKILKKKEMDDRQKMEATNYIRSTRTPVWVFSGIIIFTLLVGTGIFLAKKDEKQDLACIINPAIGDIYQVSFNDAKYSKMKLVAIKRDSLFVKFHKLETNKIMRLHKLEDDNYDDSIQLILKTDLKKMYDDKEIFDVQRH